MTEEVPSNPSATNVQLGCIYSTLVSRDFTKIPPFTISEVIHIGLKRRKNSLCHLKEKLIYYQTIAIIIYNVEN